jgi:hypothetical protein
MRSRAPAAHAKEIEAFIRFEEALMDYLFSNGHLSPALRPLWVERLRARRSVPGAEALDTHREAVRDCLEMVRAWGTAEVADADHFFTRRGAPTIGEMRSCLHWNPSKTKHRR